MRTWKMVLALALCLALLAACGPSTPLITTPAKDMNLNAGQVGSGYSLSEEQGLDEFAASMDVSNVDEISDASYRMFQDPEGGIVLSLVITLKKAATQNDLKELTEGFEEGFAGSMSDVSLQEYKAPAIGEEATIRGAELADLGMSMYFLGFRQNNVIGVLAVVGLEGFASEAIINDLGKKLAGQVK